MKFINIIIGCLMLFSTSQAFANETNKTGTSNANAPRAVVTSTSAQFWFPVGNANGTWKWNTIGPDVGEYLWMVKVDAGIDEYEFGFARYSTSNKKQTGTLSDLLASGQIDLWRNDPKKRSATVMQRPQDLRVLVKDAGLLFELTDTEYIKHLFGTKPQLVEFRISGFLQKKESFMVHIKYAPEFQNNKSAK